MREYGQRWWRFSAYRIRQGRICPAPGAELQEYDPWPAAKPRAKRDVRPYTMLFALLDKIDRDKRNAASQGLAPASQAALLEWCRQHGLLGILRQRVAFYAIPVGEVGERWYTPHPAGWSHRLTAGRSGGRARVLIQNLKDGAFTEEPLWGETCSRFLSLPKRIRQRYPRAFAKPDTEDFWRCYGEPLEDFLGAARLLRDAVRNLDTARKDTTRRAPHVLDANTEGVRSWGLDVLNRLVGSVGVALRWDQADLRYVLGWTTRSLLATLAMLALQDMAGGQHLGKCEVCEKFFIATDLKARFCSSRCYATSTKRRTRANRRADMVATGAPATTRPALRGRSARRRR